MQSTVLRLRPYALSILRIMVALLLLQHGLSKHFAWPVAMTNPPADFSLLWFAGVIEVAGGVLLALGIMTRPVAFILSGELAFAYFLAHAPKSFFPLINGGEAAVLFCFVFFYLAFAGGGPLALDELRWRPRAVPRQVGAR